MINQKGFTLVEVLLIVLIMSVIGFAGYTVWNNNQDSKTDVVESAQSSDNVASTEIQPVEEVALQSSVSCTPLYDISTADKSAIWKKRVESSSEIAQLISGYSNDTAYETRFGTECTLNDDSKLVSYSHYYHSDNGDGTLELVATKGLARFDGESKIFVDTASPCSNGPPDATSSASITGVKDSVTSVTCAGYSEEEIQFNITDLSYN